MIKRRQCMRRLNLAPHPAHASATWLLLFHTVPAPPNRAPRLHDLPQIKHPPDRCTTRRCAGGTARLCRRRCARTVRAPAKPVSLHALLTAGKGAPRGAKRRAMALLANGVPVLLTMVQGATVASIVRNVALRQRSISAHSQYITCLLSHARCALIRDRTTSPIDTQYLNFLPHPPPASVRMHIR